MPLRAILYARVSTDMQVEEGKSIAAQLSEMKEFATVRGWQVAAEFVDPGFTGSSTDRPGLKSLLQAVTDGLGDLVLVHELSRLSRSIFDTFALLDELGKAEVGFASVKDPDFDFTTPTGRFFLTILSAMNQYYLDLLKMHTAKSKRERAKQGLTNASVMPYGYRATGQPDTPPTIADSEAPAIRLAFETYAAGNSSYQEIADLLNERGYRARSGRRFAKDVVDDLLHNPYYTGVVIYRQSGKEPELFPGQHPALISPELFEACQAVRERRRGSLRAHQPSFETYLLNDLATCNVCGRKLRAQKTITNRYYREKSHERGFVDCPHARSGVVADVVDEQVEAIIRALRLPDDWQAEIESQLDRAADIQTLKNKRQRLQAEMKRLRTAYIKGDFDESETEYDQRLAELKRELAMLPETDLAAIEAAAEQLEELSQVWDEAELETKRDLLRLILADLAVDVPQGRVVSLTPFAPFHPLFRQAAHLRELEPGRFVPAWPPEQAAGPALAPITRAPHPQPGPDWPLLVEPLPEPPASQRITPLVSHFLKARDFQQAPVGRIVEIGHPLAPALRLDSRKWPGLTLEQLTPAQLGALPPGSVSLLYTAFQLPPTARRADWLAAGAAALDQRAWWGVLELLPGEMPGHWLFYYFPESWELVRQQARDEATLYLQWQQLGFEVQLTPQSYYQAVWARAALALAEARPAGSMLAQLPPEAYERGLARLRALPAGQLVASQVTVGELIATRGEGNTVKARYKR